jgi:KTSC domain
VSVPGAKRALRDPAPAGCMAEVATAWWRFESFQLITVWLEFESFQLITVWLKVRILPAPPRSHLARNEGNRVRLKQPQLRVSSMKRLVIAIVGALWLASVATAETIVPKYGEPVDLASFSCSDVTRSSFIKRVCFDKAKSYMLIRLKDTYYHYCNIPESTMTAFMAADSMGRFFNSQVKGNYDCRVNLPPKY